jgi:hypothetical protein
MSAGSASPAVFSRPVPVSTVVTRAADTITASSTQPPAPVDTTAEVDPERLARQLFEPVSRLLRADLVRGRERAGRAHDRRR